MLAGRMTQRRISSLPPPRVRISFCMSGSTSRKLVYRLMMVPKMATEMPAVMIVRMLAPSQTMSSGARADLGRLLSTTR